MAHLRPLRNPIENQMTPRAYSHPHQLAASTPAPAFHLRDSTPADRPWISATIAREFASTTISSARRLIDTTTLPAILAIEGDQPVGLATYRIDADELELVTLVACRRAGGIGTALLNAVIALARANKLRRLFLTMSNDNVPAFGFYQQRGLRLCKLHLGALTDARAHIPDLPRLGHHNIEMRDDLEFEILLRAAPALDSFAIS